MESKKKIRIKITGPAGSGGPRGLGQGRNPQEEKSPKMIVEKHSATVENFDQSGSIYVVRASTWERNAYVLIRAPSAIQAAQQVQTRDGVTVEVFEMVPLTKFVVSFQPVLTEEG